jgi:hypothetical protein
MTNSVPYCVVLDANVWVAERLLQSTMGSAVLYALTATNGIIGLPEVVELEVNAVLQGLAEKATDNIAKATQLLQQLSGHKLYHRAHDTGDCGRNRHALETVAWRVATRSIFS